MARISTLPAGTPESTVALVGVLNSTTVQFDVEDVLGVPITAEGDLLIGDSSNFTTRLAAGTSGQILGLTTGVPSWQADPSTGHITTAGTSGQILQTTGGAAAWKATTAILAETLGTAGDILVVSSAGVVAHTAASSGAVLVYSTADGAIGPKWAVLDPGELLVHTSANVTTALAVATSGAVLTYSTVDGSIGPQWVVLDPGELLTQTSAAVTTALAVAAEGSILEYSTADGSIGPQWLGLTSGSLIYGDANKAATVLAAPGSSGALLQTDGSSVPAWLAAGTSGQQLKATPMPKWIDDDVSLSFVIDGGGTTITASTKGWIHIPWNFGIEAVELSGDASGDLVVDVYVEDFSSTPASSNSKITASAPPTLSGAQRTSDATLTGWTTLVTAGDYITIDVTGDTATIVLATLVIKGKKLSTA